LSLRASARGRAFQPGTWQTHNIGLAARRKDHAFTSLADGTQYMQVTGDMLYVHANNARSIHSTNICIFHYKHRRPSFLAHRRRPRALAVLLITAAGGEIIGRDQNYQHA
jgi:hypothetical protein